MYCSIEWKAAETAIRCASFKRPQNVSYEARAPLENVDGLMYIGLRGKGKVHAEPQTVAERTWRYLIRTFNFKL